MAYNSDYLSVPLDSGENPALIAARLRTTKLETQTIINTEHYLGVSGDDYDYMARHRAGSAVAFPLDFDTYYDDNTTYTPLTNPFGSAWEDADVGRLYINTVDGDFKYMESQEDNVATFKSLFEESIIDETQDPTATLTTVQEKIDALAAQVLAITGTDTVEAGDVEEEDYEGTDWTVAPEIDLAAVNTSITTSDADIDTLQSDVSTLEGKVDVLEGTGTSQGVGTNDDVVFDSLTVDSLYISSTTRTYTNGTISGVGSVIITKGFIALGSYTASAQVKDSGGTWRTVNSLSYSDGSNMRFYNSESTESKTYAYVRITT